MTLSFGPDEMRNIMLRVLDVRDLMEALFACQLLVTGKREHNFLVLVTLMIKSHITLIMFSVELELENIMS